MPVVDYTPHNYFYDQALKAQKETGPSFGEEFLQGMLQTISDKMQRDQMMKEQFAMTLEMAKAKSQIDQQIELQEYARKKQEVLALTQQIEKDETITPQQRKQLIYQITANVMEVGTGVAGALKPQSAFEQMMQFWIMQQIGISPQQMGGAMPGAPAAGGISPQLQQMQQMGEQWLAPTAQPGLPTPPTTSAAMPQIGRPGIPIATGQPQIKGLSLGGAQIEIPEIITTPTKTKVEQEILDIDAKLLNISELDRTFQDDFLTYPGALKQFGERVREKAGMGEMSEFSMARAGWRMTAQELYLQKRKEITGVAARPEEKEEIGRAIPNPTTDSPSEYKRKSQILGSLLFLHRQRLLDLLKRGIVAPTEEDLGKISIYSYESLLPLQLRQTLSEHKGRVYKNKYYEVGQKITTSKGRKGQVIGFNADGVPMIEEIK